VADLDYAYLADYAVVQGGKLTAVGASFTHVSIVQLGATFGLSIAGRVRAPEHVAAARLSFHIAAPDDLYVIDAEADIGGDEARPYRGRVGLLFAATTVVSLIAEGLYTIDISVDGTQQRRLAFEVSLVSVVG
jgi:hypothetical protein